MQNRLHISKLLKATICFRTTCCLTVRLTVRYSRPCVSGVMVVGVSLWVQMIKENIHLVRRQELCRRLHVVVRKAGVVRVRVLAVQDGMVMRHPPRLIRRYIHLSALSELGQQQQCLSNERISLLLCPVFPRFSFEKISPFLERNVLLWKHNKMRYRLLIL